MSQRFQFSLRSLFWLTSVVAVVVGTMSMLGRTQHFRALGSYHAYLALLPIAGVWVAWRTNSLTGRRLAIASIVLYFASLLLPSIRWDNNRLVFGFAATPLSFIGSTMHPFQGPPPDDATILPWPLYFEFDTRDWLACCMGFIANVTYGLVLLLIILRRRSNIVRKYLSWSAFLSAVLLLIPLGLSTRLDTIYIGYGVWVAAMLAMWLGVREENREHVLE